jgi:hypothetical protein
MRTHPSARLKLWISLELISMFNSDLFTYPFLPFLNITSTVMVNTSFLRQGGMVALCRRPAKTPSAVFEGPHPLRRIQPLIFLMILF